MPSQSPGTRQAKAPVRTAVSSRACTEAPGQQVRKVASHKGVVGAYRVEGVDPDGVLPVFHSVDDSGTARGPALDDGLARPRGGNPPGKLQGVLRRSYRDGGLIVTGEHNVRLGDQAPENLSCVVGGPQRGPVVQVEGHQHTGFAGNIRRLVAQRVNHDPLGGELRQDQFAEALPNGQPTSEVPNRRSAMAKPLSEPPTPRLSEVPGPADQVSRPSSGPWFRPG